MKIIIILSSILLLFSCQSRTKRVEIKPEIQSIIDSMTLEEKVDQLSGRSFDTNPNERFGIQGFHMTDGPMGVGQHTKNGQATAFPAIVALASTWDTTFAYQMGQAIAKEAKMKGRNFLLAPCVNIQRFPLGGRNFESFSEDPFLTSQLAVRYIEGVQDEGIIACAKHFVCNNQERNRINLNVKVDERALREIFFPAFKAAVQQANVGAVMTSYNMLNGVYSGQNEWLINEVLKEEWGFNGVAISDWESVYSARHAAMAGLDIEMPWAKHFGDTLINLIENGHLTETILDNKLDRIIRLKERFEFSLPEDERDTTFSGVIRHEEIANEISKASIVLLKNKDEILPIVPGKKIAVIGPNANVARIPQKGSVNVKPISRISPMQAIRKMGYDSTALSFSKGVDLIQKVRKTKLISFYTKEGYPGFDAKYFANENMEGKPSVTRVDSEINFDWQREAPFPEFDADNFSVSWKGYLIAEKSGDYILDVSSAGGYKLYFDQQKLIDQWFVWKPLDIQSKHVYLEKGVRYPVEIQYFESEWEAAFHFGVRHMTRDKSFNEAIKNASEADVAIVFAGLSDMYEQEGNDRFNYDLPYEQVRLIREVAKVNSNTVVVINAGTPVELDPWLGDVKALLYAWYGGQTSGRAIADVLFGHYNPGGKLPFTYPDDITQHPGYMTYNHGDIADYQEGILVGYRYYDTKKIKNKFPFGFGLSYTEFKYSDLQISICSQKVKATFRIQNTGHYEGHEIAQLYIAKTDSKVFRAKKELKGFTKVRLKPGASQNVCIELNLSDLKYFDTDAGSWELEEGNYQLMINTNAEENRLSADFYIN